MNEEVKRLVKSAQLIQAEANLLSAVERHVSDRNYAGLYDVLIRDQSLRSTSRKLFMDGHYKQAVEEAYKCLNNFVKKRSGLHKDGADLMQQAFSENNPILKLNNLRSESERNEQKGYMLIFSGCMTGVRNPRAHEHMHTDSPEVALQLLMWASHLMTRASNAKKTRNRSKP